MGHLILGESGHRCALSQLFGKTSADIFVDEGREVFPALGQSLHGLDFSSSRNAIVIAISTPSLEFDINVIVSGFEGDYPGLSAHIFIGLHLASKRLGQNLRVISSGVRKAVCLAFGSRCLMDWMPPAAFLPLFRATAGPSTSLLAKCASSVAQDDNLGGAMG